MPTRHTLSLLLVVVLPQPAINRLLAMVKAPSRAAIRFSFIIYLISKKTLLFSHLESHTYY